MRRVPLKPALTAVLAVVVFLATEVPAHAAGSSVPFLAVLRSPSTGLNVVIAAVVGLVAGGLTFYLRTRGRRGEDRD
ncbi:hypothetical protein [Phytomonospora endophytica]|uniref:DUF1049 domain-containing protein n=1 Tax=Phytomonospora endophytica TaxID=714109 RepID=A0A841FYC3_9ACTN|nr:hypothetical protein [Phytomonospora endophytica]MBB6037449.1 hypothetical protein [Phytomonospora endophytica]GIG70699.1 hypothetical protein Pen01_69940 [Phytomonospora endophytica]